MPILMGLKYPINFTVAFFKSLYFYSLKKCHSVRKISEKVHIETKLLKTEFDKYDNSRISAFCITSIYLIQFIINQSYRKSY